jgi:hypothetical protein
MGAIFNAIAILLGLGALWLWWRKGDRSSIKPQLPLNAA